MENKMRINAYVYRQYLDKEKYMEIEVPGEFNIKTLKFKENKVNCVVHMAAKYIKTHSTSEELKELISSNIIFSSILCEHAIKYNVPFFINTGSFFEYKIKNTPIDETDTLEPYNLYAATTIAFADILKFYTSKYKINTIDLKLFAPFGEKDNPKLFDLLMTSLLEGKELDFTGGEQKWDFTYVQDIVTSYIQSIKKIENLSGYNIFNIGSGRVHSIRDIVSFLEEVSGKKLHINWGIKPYAENEILYACSNNSKAKRILEWEPKYNIKSALTKLYKFYVSKDG